MPPIRETRRPRMRRLRSAPTQGRGRISKRAYNQLLVRATLFRNGPASRVELGTLTGLPLSALTLVCSDLLEQGFISEPEPAPARSTARGRRRKLLEINASGLGVVCLRYDGFIVESCVADLAGYVRWRKTWNQARNAEQIARLLPVALEEALSATPIPQRKLIAVGVADPGLVDRASGRALRAVNVPGWENVAVRDILKSATRMKLPILVERGDGLQALGETAYGAARGARSVLFVSLVDDGVGGGLVEDGRLAAGRNGGAGEIGHMNLGPDGPLCGCGLRGCLEAHIAPRRLLDKLRADYPESSNVPDFAALLQGARDGQEPCRAVLAHAAELLARAVGSAINLLNPERVLLGGYFTTAGEHILEPLRQALPRYCVRELLEGLDVKLAERGADAAYLGIVAQVRESLFAFPPTERTAT